MMPIKKGFDEIYTHVIKPLLADLGIRSVRADEIYSTNPIVEDIWDQIQTAGWLVADLTGRNPNVLYELGLAHGIDRDVILLTQNIADVPFDLQHWRCVVYEQTITGGEELRKNLSKAFVEDPEYVRVPVALLTEKFKNSFRVHRTKTTVKLSGPHGRSAKFDELWELSPLRSGPMREFFRKIQTAGQLRDIECTDCDVRVSRFMEGVILLAMVPSDQNQSSMQYALRYTVVGGFAPAEEFWNFDFDCPTDFFEYGFQFAAECRPHNFRASYRVSGDDTSIDPTIEERADSTLIGIQMKNVPSGAVISFKWSWR